MRLSGRAAMGGDAPNPALGSKKGPPRVQHRGSARSLLTTTTTTRTHPVTIMHLLSSAAYGSISLSWSPPQRPQMRMPCSDAVALALALALAGLGWTGRGQASSLRSTASDEHLLGSLGVRRCVVSYFLHCFFLSFIYPVANHTRPPVDGTMHARSRHLRR
jgi:hypothetical protein